MKILSLNIAGGAEYSKIVSLLEAKCLDGVDVFCLQEVFSGGAENAVLPNTRAHTDMFEQLQSTLKDYNGYTFFSPRHPGCYIDDAVSGGIEFGLAMFVRKGLSVEHSGGFVTYENAESIAGFTKGAAKSRDLTGLAQFVDVDGMRIINVHGISLQGIGKGDTPERLVQSQKILTCAKEKERSCVVGDLNLTLETSSVALLEKDMKNLIRVYGIQTTRTSRYTGSDPYADYVFVSNNVEVDDFAVLSDEVSDHAALLVDVAV